MQRIGKGGAAERVKSAFNDRSSFCIVRDIEVGKRYVPKTYNNRRALRVLFGTIVSLAVAAVVLFLLLFFGLRHYDVGGGKLEIPWLMDDEIILD